MIYRRKAPHPKAPWTRAFPTKQTPHEARVKAPTKRQRETRQYSRKAANFVTVALLSPTRWFCPVAFKIRGEYIRVNQVHHIRGRLGSLLLDERWWLAVSQFGQDWIHSHIEEARTHGWIAQKGEWNKI